MRKIIYVFEVIIIFVIIGIMCFLNMNAPRMHCINSLREEPSDEYVVTTYLKQVEQGLNFTDEEKFLLTQRGIVLVDEKTGHCTIRKDNQIVNIYYPILFKKTTFLFELYYLENNVLVRDSDNVHFGEISNLNKKQISEEPD